MKGDFSRYLFDPKKDYSAVLSQQGRVELDSEKNEQQEINQYRIETEALDVIGRCGAPIQAAGFALTVQANNQLLIGAGRYYVEGILTQCWEEVLYSEQPHLPEPPDLVEPLSEAIAGILYIDVWKRHITHLNDPRIREVALNGPDTTTRLKTLWQIKLLPIFETDDDRGEELTCDSEVSAWDELTAASTGTLNARTAPPDTTNNPCLIPPSAGYQRLENQLYRVEIHQVMPDAVTFKWSRDNGSVVTAIERISGTEVTVQTIEVGCGSGFEIGQWVEISDDRLELNGEPGELVRIIDIDPSGRILTMETAPSSLGDTDGITPAYKPILRIWNQTDDTATIVGIEIAFDTWIELEAGIEVQFSNGTYRTGDYWEIPARTVTGQIEWFSDDSGNPLPQLPFGIKHHYCRLAIVQLIDNALALLQDCRKFFDPLTEIDPGESCCTAVVQPGENIQDAINSLPAAGGCVCLKTGTHTIQQPIVIGRSNVVLEGESTGTTIVRPNGVNLLRIGNPSGRFLVSDIVVKHIRFRVSGAPDSLTDALDLPLVALVNCRDVTVQQCKLSLETTNPTPNSPIMPVAYAIGLLTWDTERCTVHDNDFNLTVFGIWGEISTGLVLSNNRMVAPSVAAGDSNLPLGSIGILLNSGIETMGEIGLGPTALFSGTPFTGSEAANCRIEQNYVEDYWVGILSGIGATNSQIRHNQVLRRSFQPSLPDSDLLDNFRIAEEPFLYGIIALAPHVVIADNYLNLNSEGYGGIRATAAFTRIEHNRLEANIETEITQLPIAIFLGPMQTTQEGSANHSTVGNNIIIGNLGGIVVLDSASVQISNNQIQLGQTERISAGVASAGIVLGSTKNILVAENQITNAQVGIALLGTAVSAGTGNRITKNHLDTGNLGIIAARELALEISYNVIENMTAVGFLGGLLLESTLVTHNRIVHCGYAPIRGFTGSSIAVLFSFTDLYIDSCHILNTGIARDNPQQNNQGVTWGIGIIAVLLCRVGRNTIGYSDVTRLRQLNPDQEHRGLGLVPIFSEDARGQQPLGSAIITDNMIWGIGLSCLVQVFGARLSDNIAIAFEKVIFSNNSSEHFGEQIVSSVPNPATVFLAGQHLIATNNHVKEPPNTRNSIFFNYHERAVCIGNLTTDSRSTNASLNLNSFVPPPPDLNSFNAQV